MPRESARARGAIALDNRRYDDDGRWGDRHFRCRRRSCWRRLNPALTSAGQEERAPTSRQMPASTRGCPPLALQSISEGVSLHGGATRPALTARGKQSSEEARRRWRRASVEVAATASCSAPDLRRRRSNPTDAIALAHHEQRLRRVDLAGVDGISDQPLHAPWARRALRSSIHRIEPSSSSMRVALNHGPIIVPLGRRRAPRCNRRYNRPALEPPSDQQQGDEEPGPARSAISVSIRSSRSRAPIPEPYRPP